MAKLTLTDITAGYQRQRADKIEARLEAAGI